MTGSRLELNELLHSLRKNRDQLALRLHLARAEARDEWARIEKEWQGIDRRLDAAGKVAAETSAEVLDRLGQAAEEIRKGYERLRKLF
jgi:hypothetical protein